MSLWKRDKLLTQPPSFRRVGHSNIHSAQAGTPAHEAGRAHQAAQFGREEAVKRTGGRRAVVRG
ncbi:hypothetical protein KW843_22845 [Acidovorax sp. sif1233]|uniref:hypothetical protein n=1 Tax=Acidovorax sp. sif1233 TaxID=2854792 RepID=UPI001C46D60B|nr:hypothetical protein [Acidovorax sp. sif1233]MBV7457337.1 hypothetical protein [Acidovorax sp. sif1233]